MELIKKILIKLLMLAVLLFAVNLTYKHTLWKVDRSKYADVLDSLNNIKDSTDILYISSSSNYFHPITDKVGYTVSGFIDEQFPNLKVNAINKGYMHAGAFYSVLRNIPKKSPIKTVVVCVNMRSFGAFWLYSETETAYSQMELMCNNNYPLILRRFLLSLDYYDNVKKDEREKQFKTAWREDTLQIPEYDVNTDIVDWDSTCVCKGGFVTIDGKPDNDKLNFKCNIIKAFAYTLDTVNNIRFKQFDNIIALAKKRNWNLVFNILPEDYDKAIIMVGDVIPYIIDKNVKLFIEKYKNSGVKIIDNHRLLSGSCFYEKYPTEHYTTEGKKKLASVLANKLREIYPEQKYSQLQYINELDTNKTSFKFDSITNLTKTNQFSKMYRITSLFAYKQKIDSVFVEYTPITEIQTDSVSFVIEYVNKSNIYSWEMYPLKEFENKNNKRKNTLPLPKILDSNDQIRMYFWNAGNDEVLISNPYLYTKRNIE